MEAVALNIASHFVLVFFLYWQYISRARTRELVIQLMVTFSFLTLTELGRLQEVNDIGIILFQVMFLIGSGILILKEVNVVIFITTFNGIATVLPGRIVGNIMCLYLSDISNPYRVILAVIVSCGFHVLVVYFILKYIGKFFDSLSRDKDFPWGIMVMIPILYYIAVYLLMNFPMNFWDQPMNMAVAEVVSLLAAFAYLLMMQTLKYQKNNSTLYYNNQEYELMIQQMQGRLEVGHDKQQEAAIIRHDQRHVNNVVRQLIEEGETEMALAVLDTHDAEMDATAMKLYCKNVVINSVLEFTASRCQAMGIELEVQADMPKELSVPELELAVVISNMLENAIRATSVVKKERKISFLSMKKGDKQIIQITNPFIGVVSFDEESHLPVSDQGDGHGLGMQSIIIFAKKHDAVFDCQEEDGKFVTRLLLQGGEGENE